MLFIILLTGFLLSLQFQLKGDISLSRNGKTGHVIVYAEREKEAAEELKLHLDRITGADFKVVKEKENRKLSGPGIYLGDTEFAAQRKMDKTKLRPEEYQVRTFGDDIVIIGGVSRGTLYGTYELLERFGCRWLAPDTTVIPKNPNLSAPALKLRHNPDFASRYIYDDFPKARSRGKLVYEQTVRQKRRLRATLPLWSDTTARYPESHNFYCFVDPDHYFPDHPEYFSMDSKGKRFRGTLLDGRQGGNLCLTNPDVVEITWNSLVKYIELDRKTLPKEKWPTVYDISQQDMTPFICLCPECRAVTEREGSESGLLIHFLNRIASRLKGKYPGIMLSTLAYVGCSKAPAKIRPLDNIIIRWCNLYSVNDCFRSITHPVNLSRKKEFDQWHKTGAIMGLWEYWNMGGRYFSPLRVETCIDGLTANIRYFKKKGAVRYFSEFESDYDRHYSQNFAFLNLYAAYKLMNDTSSDLETLIGDFMKGYYGPAEEPMTEFLTMLRSAVKSVDPKMRMHTFETSRPYCTPEFMEKVWSLLMQAYGRTAPGSLYRRHTEEEMLAPISVILRRNLKIGDRKFMLEKFREIRNRHIDSLTVGRKYKDLFRKKLEAEMSNFEELDLTVPEPFKGKNIIHFGWPKISWVRNKEQSYVNDPDAAGGRTVSAPQTAKLHDMKQNGHKNFTPLDFGFYDRSSKKALHKHYDPQGIPQDEKYHWHKVGQFELDKSTILWGFYWLVQCDLSEFHRLADGVKNANLVTAWVHIKITGPAYVRGSKKPNGIYWDQVILVRPEKLELF